ncbi:MAG: hypothetical protein PVH19_13680 [Planctomycetia bacterium]|jgi:hypothetical protein
MRFSKLIITLGILLILAGVVIMYYSQEDSKTHICELRVRQAATAECTWHRLGETLVWNLDDKEDELLFIKLQEAMLADLQTAREEEKTSVGLPEYNICIRERGERFPFDFKINTGRTTWIECGGGTYANLGHTQEFLFKHKDKFTPVPAAAE